MADSRAALIKLIAEKDNLEEQIKALVDALPESVRPSASRPNSLHTGKAHSTDLVDDDGFPRADIDVYQVRVIRGQIARLQNDHIAKMKEIESAMERFYSQNSESSSSKVCSTSVASSSSSPSSQVPQSKPILVEKDVGDHKSSESRPEPALQPFLVVTSVVDSSPAQHSGLKTGDQILKYGSISQSNWSMQAVSEVTALSENKSINVVIHRNPEGILNLRLVPMKWEGRGLLGCALQPVTAVQ